MLRLFWVESIFRQCNFSKQSLESENDKKISVREKYERTQCILAMNSRIVFQKHSLERHE